MGPRTLWKSHFSWYSLGIVKKQSMIHDLFIHLSFVGLEVSAQTKDILESITKNDENYWLGWPIFLDFPEKITLKSKIVLIRVNIWKISTTLDFGHKNLEGI